MTLSRQHRPHHPHRYENKLARRIGAGSAIKNRRFPGTKMVPAGPPGKHRGMLCRCSFPRRFV
jgi:hypothetical protein